MLILESFFIAYFTFVTVYAVILSIAGKFYRTPSLNDKNEHSTFAVFIPAYKEDGVIVDVAKAALVQSYPKDKYSVIIIADSLKDETIELLRALPIIVIPVSFEKSTKVKSLNKALETLDVDFDYAVILDSDNVMDTDFLALMNKRFNNETRAIQGQRKAKNTETNMAFLDGLSEAINNHIYRQGTFAMGLSSSISGSGVAFEYNLLKSKLSAMTSVGGFDRELEVILLNENISVSYFKEAIVYDEKVSNTTTFQHQRKRWMSSQFIYLRKYLLPGLKALFQGKFALFNSAVLRNIQLPRLINLGLLFFFAFVLFFVQEYLVLDYIIWPILFSLFTLSIILAVPKEYYTKELVKSIGTVPLIFFKMTILLFKLKGANKDFIHTPHTVTEEGLTKHIKRP